jgi:hypothetical protein
MDRSQIIFKRGKDYQTNGRMLINKVRDKIDLHLLTVSDKMNDPLFKDMFRGQITEFGNELEIFQVQIPIKSFLMVNPEFNSVDLDVMVIVDLSVKIRESIVE